VETAAAAAAAASDPHLLQPREGAAEVAGGVHPMRREEEAAPCHLVATLFMVMLRLPRRE